MSENVIYEPIFSPKLIYYTWLRGRSLNTIVIECVDDSDGVVAYSGGRKSEILMMVESGNAT